MSGKKPVKRISEYDQIQAIRKHLISLKASKKRKKRKKQKRSWIKWGSLRNYHCKDCKVLICTARPNPIKCYKCKKKLDVLLVPSSR